MSEEKQNPELLSLASRLIFSRGLHKSTMGVPRLELCIGDYLIRSWAGGQVRIFHTPTPVKPRLRSVTALYTMDLAFKTVEERTPGHRELLLDLFRRELILDALANV
jgi:hypothetical protein